MFDRVNIEIVHSRRKTLCLQVTKAHSVTVRAPLRCSKKRIERFISQHQSWLESQLQYYIENPGLPVPDYSANSDIWLLGHSYNIHVELANKISFELNSNDLVVKLTRLDEAYVKSKVEGWLRQYSLRYLSQRTQELHDKAAINLPAVRTVRIRKMRRQWGNCSRTGEIKYNLSLIQYPSECIDYVICHELSHLLHFNHSTSFYAVQEQLCPNWRELKNKLETFGPS